jgi:UDP:flavonoid glycosyltransferase YjiC (YdhE family)
MCITILSVGSLGDVQPYLALAVGLKCQGYPVRLAANSNFADLAEQYQIDFFPIQINSFEFVQNQQAQSWLESGSVIDLIVNTNRVIRPVLNQLFEDVWNACQGSELIIYHSYALPFVYYYAEQLEVRCIPASLHPMPNRAHATVLTNFRRTPGKAFNLFSHLLVDQICWQVFWQLFRNYWKGKADVSILSPYQKILKERKPILCAYSPVVLPRPADLPDQVVITGYWFLDAPPAWQPDPALNRFLDSGPPPIYVGFGSMGNPARNRETAEIVFRALSETGQRAVLAGGWSRLSLNQQLPRDVFLLESIPHMWMFPRMTAIVHHGGAGTTGMALHSGKPSVVVPHFGDQHFWGRRIAELGAGPMPIPRKQVSTARLAQALALVTQNSGIREKASSIGARISAEAGVDRAIEVIRAYVHT